MNSKKARATSKATGRKASTGRKVAIQTEFGGRSGRTSSTGRIFNVQPDSSGRGGWKVVPAPASRARNSFSELINRVAFGGERIPIERHGKPVAAIVPIEDLEFLERLEDRLDGEAALAAQAETGGKCLFGRPQGQAGSLSGKAGWVG